MFDGLIKESSQIPGRLPGIHKRMNGYILLRGQKCLNSCRLTMLEFTGLWIIMSANVRKFLKPRVIGATTHTQYRGEVP